MNGNSCSLLGQAIPWLTKKETVLDSSTLPRFVDYKLRRRYWGLVRAIFTALGSPTPWRLPKLDTQLPCDYSGKERSSGNTARFSHHRHSSSQSVLRTTSDIHRLGIAAKSP